MNSLQKRWNKRTLARNVITCLFVALILSMMTVNVFAVTVEWKPPDNSGMGSQEYFPGPGQILSNEALGNVINIVLAVADSIAVVVVGLYLFQLIISSNSKTAESSLSAIKTTIISFALLNSLKLMVMWILTATGYHIYQFS